MWGDQTSSLVIQRQAQQICQGLRDNLTAAANFAQWLAAQEDTDLTNAGFSAADITTLRSAFADLVALSQITYGGLPGGSYPQPAGTYDYSVHARQIIGPQ